MSAPRRRSRRLAAAFTAAPSPSTPPPSRLLDLPTDLLVRVVSRCDPADIARVAAVSLLFHTSLAEDGIRLWARERGFELPALPEGEGCAVRWLCFVALLRKFNPPARAAAGGAHSLFIDGEGRLSSCGSEVWTLGHGEGVTRLNTPTRLPSTLGGERAVSVSAGDMHSLALTADGNVWSWGYGDFGMLGHGDEQNQLLPKQVEAFAGRRVVAVSAGGVHSLAITADGAVWSWGEGAGAVLGHGEDRSDQLLPKKVEALAGQRVAAAAQIVNGERPEEVCVWEPRHTGAVNDHFSANPDDVTAFVAMAWLNCWLLEEQDPEVWARYQLVFGDLDRAAPRAANNGRPYRLHNTCFGGVAINMAVGTCWHVDDTDVLWGRTMVSIMAWGHRRFRGGDFCYLQEGTVRRVAIGHE